MSAPENAADARRRRSILIALSVETGFKMAPRALRARLDEVGYALSLDRLYTDCAWLAEMGLVRAEAESPVRLTDRGLDVVRGSCRAHGVASPEPGELE